MFVRKSFCGIELMVGKLDLIIFLVFQRGYSKYDLKLSLNLKMEFNITYHLLIIVTIVLCLYFLYFHAFYFLSLLKLMYTTIAIKVITLVLNSTELNFIKCSIFSMT